VELGLLPPNVFQHPSDCYNRLWEIKNNVNSVVSNGIMFHENQSTGWKV